MGLNVATYINFQKSWRAHNGIALRKALFISLLALASGCKENPKPIATALERALPQDGYIFMSEHIADELGRCGRIYTQTLLCLSNPEDTGNELSLLLGYSGQHRLTGMTLGQLKAKIAFWKADLTSEYVATSSKFLN